MTSEEEVVPGSTWLVYFRGAPCKVRVVSVIQRRSGAVRFQLYNETTKEVLHKPRSRGYLREPWFGSLPSRTCSTCDRVFSRELLAHVCRIMRVVPLPLPLPPGLTSLPPGLTSHACADVKDEQAGGSP